ncbi:MAG: flagellar biosynthesis anti-sigma factor FlgM [Defluviitaleaceae bacterium]|nr:flagellar biosynthesis anti-sigma factor FlgM [Defluviitaleaceae bacterium]
MDFRIDGVRPTFEVHKTDKTGAVSRLSRTSGKKDNVALSSQGRDYQMALRALKEVPDIRENRVNEVLDKIESGSFDLSSKDIASKMLSLFD